MKSDLRIVYMGTPDFAVPALNRLLAENYNVVGVVTTPDRAIGRHHEAPYIGAPLLFYRTRRNRQVYPSKYAQRRTGFRQLHDGEG